MIDVKTPLRTAYYSLLNGQLSLNSIPVAVSDTILKLAANSDKYVILYNENGRMVNTQQSLGMEEMLRVDIVSRGTRVSNDDVDAIAGQILALVMPTPSTTGLTSTSVSIQNVRIQDDRYLPLRQDGALNVARRMITFIHTVTPIA